jgi:hypothetical protein
MNATQMDLDTSVGKFFAVTKTSFRLFSNPAFIDLINVIKKNPNLIMPKEKVAANRCLTLADGWATRKKEELMPAFQSKGSTICSDGMRSHGRLVTLLILHFCFSCM